MPTWIFISHPRFAYFYVCYYNMQAAVCQVSPGGLEVRSALDLTIPHEQVGTVWQFVESVQGRLN
jgi:hypothetical protein